MKIFIWIIVVMFVIDIIGKAIILSKDDFVRTKGMIVADMLVLICFIVWASFLLGSNN